MPANGTMLTRQELIASMVDILSLRAGWAAAITSD
jgi:hypothetical protein